MSDGPHHTFRTALSRIVHGCLDCSFEGWRLFGQTPHARRHSSTPVS
jgi:hypothetical protein